jgi:hypothetical protein
MMGILWAVALVASSVKKAMGLATRERSKDVQYACRKGVISDSLDTW